MSETVCQQKYMDRNRITTVLTARLEYMNLL